MKILNLAFKDLTQILRDKKSLLFLAAMPVIFTLFMGFAYRSGEGDSAEDQRMTLAWVEEAPADALGGMLYARLEESDTLKPVRMEKEEAIKSLQRGKVDGVLVIPPGFGEAAETGSILQLTLLADTTSTEGQALYQLLRAPVSQLMSAVQIGRMSVEVSGDPAEQGPALALAWKKWDESSARSVVRVEKAASPKKENWFGDNPYNQASPGILVQFAIFGLVTSAQVLVQERKNRTLQRLMTTAMRPWEILAGHMLAMFTIVFLQSVTLVLFGQWLLKVDYLREPVGAFLVLAALGLWVASMGLLIGVMARSDDQVVLYSMIAMFVLSALGGTWFPLDTAGEVFAAVGKLLPSAWAMTGLQNILLRGLGLASLWLPAGALAAYALGFLALAVWRFRAMKV